ncbi:glycosyltransferase family 2 protein [Roseimaritima ulvae]|uniref:Undecaprenyl-phosphate mannosyltransferase n=1 Tax=Roseimaritima ulvae TaxID=980254 RepID=A0A5B9R0P1_9BACT|nr:glycosyltransferase family 2 protein [Roseimaritima ulvae]QEG43800.1 Undecaprenyl-phosphate mannosyltransferase [Roseimaritima ulvae]
MRHENERWLAALPVFNEATHVDAVLDEVLQYAADVLVVDDGSSDGTSELLARRDDVRVVHHPQNRGYGAALQSAFQFAIDKGFDGLVTLDCDGQHQPKRIPRFIEAGKSFDIVSGSRYLKQYEGDSQPPPQRLFINRRITAQLNDRLGLNLTDGFCGFKAYRTEALRKLRITDNGYAMPLQLWVEAAAADLSIMELPVPLIYLDLERSFGGSLDHAETRLRYYNQIIEESMATVCAQGRVLPESRNRFCNNSLG